MNTPETSITLVLPQPVRVRNSLIMPNNIHDTPTPEFRPWYRSKPKVLSFLLLLSVFLFSLFFFLDKLLKTPYFAKPIPISVPSPEELYHTEQIRKNAFISLLHQTHEIVKDSDCWICLQLPAYVGEGMPLLQIPLPFLPSCYALYLVFSRIEIVLALRKLSLGFSTKRGSALNHKSAYSDFDKDVLKKGQCDLVTIPNATFPFSSHFAPFSENDIYYPDKLLVKSPATNAFAFLKLRNIDVQGSICIEASEVYHMGYSTDCNMTYHMPDLHPSVDAPLYVGDSIYFICGSNAHMWLPKGWSGRCHLGFVLPAISIKHNKDVPHPVIKHLPRSRRDVVNQGDTAADIAGDLMKAFIPWYGPAINSRDIRRLARLLEATISETADALENITIEMQAIRLVALQNRMALDMILAESGGTCKIIGFSCCSYVYDSSTSVRESLKRLRGIGSQVHVETGSWDIVHSIWGFFSLWGWKIGMVLLTGILIILGCCLCVNCLPACCQYLAQMCAPRPFLGARGGALMMQDVAIQELMQIEITEIDLGRPALPPRPLPCTSLPLDPFSSDATVYVSQTAAQDEEIYEDVL